MPRNTTGNLHKRPVSRTFIRSWREYRGLSQETLAERAGITKATLSRIETGKQPYSQRILEALAEALGCSAPDLLSREPDSPAGTAQLWEIMEHLNPSQRAQAVRILKAFANESGEAA